MRILIICPNFSPKQNARAFRWTALARYWAQQGFYIEVLTTLQPNPSPPMEDVPLTIHRVGHSQMRDWLNAKGQKSAKGPSLKVNKSTKQGLLHRIWAALYWPDGSSIWYLPARKRLLQILKKQSFDAIISVSLPFTAHLLGWVANNNQPNAKWIMDVGDPFALLKKAPKNNLFLYQHLNDRIEKKLLNKADGISVTVEGMKKAYQHFNPQSGSKTRVIPPLHTAIPSTREWDRIMDKEKINISYFGSFYTHIRSPKGILALIEHLQLHFPTTYSKLKLHFFGTIEPAFQVLFEEYPSISDSIVLHGRISREEVAFRMEESDILLNISNATVHQLPSKSVDYLMSKKPILNLYEVQADTFQQFLKDYPLLFNLPASGWTEHQLIHLLLFLKQAPGQIADLAPIQDLVHQISIAGVAQAYIDLINGDFVG